MKFNLHVPLLSLLLLSSCYQSTDANLISKQSIGLLTDSTQVRNLDLVFPNDSIVKFIKKNRFNANNRNIEVYNKNGEKILTLTPKKVKDSSSTIKLIEINSEQFKTRKGLHLNSNFQTLKNNYKISGVQNSIKNIIISVEDINSFFTIDKNNLPAELRFDMNLKIEAIQIPDDAKIKGFYVQWF